MTDTTRDAILAAIPDITRNLLEDGYEGLTEAEVRDQVDRLVAGEPTTTIIGMHARDMLTEAGLLPGESSPDITTEGD